MKTINKYYVGARHIGQAIKDGINAECTRESLAETIREAKERIESGAVECAVVVKIIRIVRTQKMPIIVETIE